MKIKHEHFKDFINAAKALKIKGLDDEANLNANNFKENSNSSPNVKQLKHKIEQNGSSNPTKRMKSVPRTSSDVRKNGEFTTKYGTQKELIPDTKAATFENRNSSMRNHAECNNSKINFGNLSTIHAGKLNSFVSKVFSLKFRFSFLRFDQIRCFCRYPNE